MRIKDFFMRNLLLVIFILATALRLWHLGSNPPSLTPDEAALGYNAYSILKTGRDEYGKILPVIFKSFGDYKPGLYVYLTVPSVLIFGLTEFATRFPSVLAGVISVWFIYLVVRKLFGREKLAILAALLLAVNPWAIYLSRGAWEVNVALALTLAGIYFFLKFLEKPKYLTVAAVFFGLTLLTYQGAKLASGIVVAILILLYWRNLLGTPKKILALTVVSGLIIAAPIVVSLFSGQAGRLNVFNVFSYPRPTKYLQDFLDEGNEKVGSLSYYLFHSETLNFTRGIMGRWFNHFSGRFLFFEGDWANPRHSAPNSGMLILADLILLIAGFIGLVRLGAKKEVVFVFLWLLLAPFPSALSRDQVHAIRAFNLVVPLVIIGAFGLEKILQWKKYVLVAFVLFYLANYSYFLDALFIHLPKHDSQYWEFGYKQIVETITPIQKNYKVIKVQQSFAQPYIYFLFYQKYDPAKYQKQAQLVASEYKGDVGYILKLDNIYFAPIDWSVNRGEHGTLFVADPVRIPPADSRDAKLFKLIKEIKYLNGEVAFKIIEVL